MKEIELKFRVENFKSVRIKLERFNNGELPRHPKEKGV